jgi:two-component system phosphate regulon sensor histidine kinase PhoR
MEASFLDHLAADLETRARLVEKQVLERLVSGQEQSLDALCKDLGKRASIRITVILASGKVLGDSEGDPARLGNLANRPEVREALAGRRGRSYSETLRQKILYVTLPLKSDDAIMGVIRTSVSAKSIDHTLRRIQVKTAIAGLIIALVAAGMTLAVSRRITRSLAELKRGAERLAQGELGRRLPVLKSEELGGLAETINAMAAQLESKIRSAMHQRTELEAVLSSLVEGVLAVDAEGRFISLNRAAGQLLGVNPAEVTGRCIEEVVRNPDLQRFIGRALASKGSVEEDIILRNDGERYLKTHGMVLRDARDRSIGALVILNDATRIRRLENVRREFVANVVHEIRTPVTSIKGFAETLLDSALNDPDNARQFLGVIARQTDRLNTIIEDLLSLSRIEQESENAEIVLEQQRIIGTLRAAVQLCEREAVAKDIRIDLACHETLVARINPHLLEQAVVNLIDNAIKYSETGSSIHVEAMQRNTEIMISVRDQGCGIPGEHLPRLFERFYRVDKARSRKLGGTGLGLAIVKHIIQAHRGRITVESIPGKGSTFRLYLPTVASG